MLFKGAYSIKSNYQIGDAYQAILPLSSTAVSSICGQPDGTFGPPQPINYADFNSPAPASAYRCQPKCFGHEREGLFNTNVTAKLCSTIYDNYDPALEIPTAAISSHFTEGLGLQRNGDGVHCSFNPDLSDGVIFDPPQALQQVGSIAGPTTPGQGDAEPVTTTAAPATTPEGILGPTGPGGAEPTREPVDGGGDEDDDDDDEENDDDRPPPAVTHHGDNGNQGRPDDANNGGNTSGSDSNEADNNQGSDDSGNDSSSSGSNQSPDGSNEADNSDTDSSNNDSDSNATGGADTNGGVTGEQSPTDNTAGVGGSDQNIGDFIASAIGMVSQTGVSGPAATGSSEGPGGSTSNDGENISDASPGGGSSGGSSNVGNDDIGASSGSGSDTRTSNGGSQSESGQGSSGSQEAGDFTSTNGGFSQDLGAIIVSATGLNTATTAAPTSEQATVATSSSESSNKESSSGDQQDKGSSSPSRSGDSIYSSSGTQEGSDQDQDHNDSSSGFTENKPSSSSNQENSEQAPNASMTQIAVITGQNNRIVTATLASDGIILPQTTLALDQGATDILGIGRISADEQSISVEGGEIVPFTSSSEDSAGSDSNGPPVLFLGDESLTLAPASDDRGFVLAGASTTLALEAGETVTLDGTRLEFPSATEPGRALPSVVLVDGESSTLGRSGAQVTGLSTGGSGTEATASASESSSAVGDGGAAGFQVPKMAALVALLAFSGLLVI